MDPSKSKSHPVARIRLLGIVRRLSLGKINDFENKKGALFSHETTMDGATVTAQDPAKPTN